MEKTGEGLPSRIDTYPHVEAKDSIYTIVEGPYNSRPRLIFCQYCKFSTISDMVGAQCKKCNSYMITLIFDDLA
jgi:hypothetical protein